MTPSINQVMHQMMQRVRETRHSSPVCFLLENVLWEAFRQSSEEALDEGLRRYEELGYPVPEIGTGKFERYYRGVLVRHSVETCLISNNSGTVFTSRFSFDAEGNVDAISTYP